MNEQAVILPNKWVWWVKGECVVEVLHRGHYPTTVIARLPDDSKTEIELTELETHKP